MTDQTGDAKDRGDVLMLTSPVGEVDTAPIASNLGRSMELAGMRSIVLNACAQGAETAEDEPVPQDSSGTEANPDGAGDKPENDNTESNVGALVDVVSAPTDELSASESGADEISEGPSLSSPAAVANQTVTPELIDRLRSEYEHVIVAAPPLLPLIAGSILSEVGGQVLLVLSIGETTRRDLSRAVEELRALGVPLTGAVLNGKPTTASKSEQSSRAKNTQSDDSNRVDQLA